MATETESSSLSGGLLVILGIIVALGIIYFFTGMNSKPGEVNINVPSATASDSSAPAVTNPPADTVTE